LPAGRLTADFAAGFGTGFATALDFVAVLALAACGLVATFGFATALGFAAAFGFAAGLGLAAERVGALADLATAFGLAAVFPFAVARDLLCALARAEAFMSGMLPFRGAVPRGARRPYSRRVGRATYRDASPNARERRSTRPGHLLETIAEKYPPVTPWDDGEGSVTQDWS